MYDILCSFNIVLFEFCDGGLVLWIKFCKYYQKYGFGELVNVSIVILGDDWYCIDVYMLEVIFFEWMQFYLCLIGILVNVDIYYILFFVGLDVFFYFYNEMKRLY